MGFYQWSQTAASNASADPTINFAEGQAPSSLNDSDRALMAAMAKWRDDNSGALVTGGTTTAYTVSSNQVFPSLTAMAGQTLRLTMNATCGVSPTLNVDSLGAKAIVFANGSAVGAGDLVSGTVHSFVYDNVNGIWVANGGATGGFASGTLMLFQQTAAPTGWTKQTTHNDKALRVVSGTASSGGSTAFSSIMAARTIGQGNLPSFNLPVTVNDPGHTHSVSVNAAAITTNGSGGSSVPLYSAASYVTASATTGIGVTVGSGGSGTAMDFAVQYVDLIIAVKN